MFFLDVISILFLTLLLCKGPHKSDCNVIPKDVFIERGSSVQITCLTSCKKECERVRWKLDNKLYMEHESKKINSSHTVLTLRNFTDRMAMLECRSLKTDSVIGGTIIRTYSKPNNLSCILHYNNQAMATPDLLTCRWEDQTYYSQNINYTVLCTSFTPPFEVCSSQETSCTADLHIMKDISIIGNYNITVRATSDHGEVFSDQYEFQSIKILKIPPPRLFSLTAHSSHVLVRWSILHRVSSYRYSCQVRHRKTIGESIGEWVLKNKTLKEKWEKEEMTIDGVDSCSNYTVAVRCVLSGDLWSDWSQEETVLTPLNSRDYRPHLWRTLIGGQKDRVRKVRAMWTEAPSACRDALTYTVKHFPYQEQGAQMGVLCENSICEISSRARKISLIVLRNESMFLEESVYFPAVEDNSLPQISHIKTTTLDGSILLCWSAPLKPVNGYMIDYTFNGDQFFYVETKNTSVNLSGLRDKTPYDITVTSLFGDKTSHSVRALQICSRRGAPGAVNISSDEAQASSVLVRWSVDPQEVCSGAVVTYLVVYHSENDRSQLNISLDGKYQEVQLKNLMSGTSYTVFVKARARNGSTRSKDLTFRTKIYGPQVMIMLTVGGSVLIILVLVAGLCCIFQLRKLKEKLVPDPAHSSVGKWLLGGFGGDEKGLHPVQLFHHPSEILPDRVDPEEAQKPTVSPSDKDGYENLLCEQAKDCVTPNKTTSPNQHSSVEMHHMSLSSESMETLSSDSYATNPYRTQSPLENPAPKTAKQFRLVPVKQRDKTMSHTVYVTLDMFGQRQCS